jgi:hypothetical protein
MGEEAGTVVCTTEVADATAGGFLWSADSRSPGADVCTDLVTDRLPCEGPDEVGILGRRPILAWQAHTLEKECGTEDFNAVLWFRQVRQNVVLT